MSQTISPLHISIADIRTASQAISANIERTPARYSQTLSRIAGCDLYLKFENFQFTASFKDRGALNKLLSLTLEQRAHGVIAMSAGNHAQAVAYHAGRLGIEATIVMPEATPFNKVKHTKDFGATVILKGANLSEAAVHARTVAETHNLTFIHPYDDALVIAGQGTIALEFIGDHPHLDCLVIPIGGGGLISGMAIAAKALKPGIQIYGVQAAAYPAMANLIHGTNRPHAKHTIAEGIGVKEPGHLTREIVKRYVTEIFLVEEHQIESALAQLLEVEKVLVEGAAAASFAAVMANLKIFAGKKVGIVLSGGNIDMRLMANVVMRELTREGRIQSLVFEIEDRPGVLAHITHLIGEMGGNILDVHHERLSGAFSAKSAALALTLEARDAVHAMEIRQRLSREGLEPKPQTDAAALRGTDG